MKNTLLILLFLIVAIHPTFSQETPKFIENELIIWLNPEVSASNFAEKFPQQLKPKRVLSKRLNIWLFEFTQANNERVERINSFRRQPDVRYAQNNHLVKSRAITPNDSYYGQQWAPAVMDLPNAWGKFGTGGVSADGDDIVIAIIDSGFDLTHQDLKFWKNTNEIPNNGIDDDNNGYIDDYDGWNANNSTGNIPSSNHGTHVSGIAGAKGNNGLGISGVNWDVNILPIAGSSTNEATVVEAYSYFRNEGFI